MATYVYTGTVADFGQHAFPGLTPMLWVIAAGDAFGPAGLLSRVRIPVEPAAPDGAFQVSLVASPDVSPPTDYEIVCEWFETHPLEGWVKRGQSSWRFTALRGGGAISGMAVTAGWSPAHVFWQPQEPDPWPVGWIWVNSLTGRVQQKVGA